MPTIEEKLAADRARFMQLDPRTVWSKVKKGGLDKARREGSKKEADALEKQLDQGLGPLFDKWTAEIGKFPKVDYGKLSAIRGDINHALNSYYGKIHESDIGPAALALKGVLKNIDEAMVANFRVLEERLKAAARESELLQRAHAALAKDDHRIVWTAMKKDGFAKAQKTDHKDKAKALEKQMDQGFGKLLDKWKVEVDKFPKLDPAKLETLGQQIVHIADDYSKKIGDAAIGPGGMVLKGALKQIKDAMTKDLQVLEALKHAAGET